MLNVATKSRLIYNLGIESDAKERGSAPGIIAIITKCLYGYRPAQTFESNMQLHKKLYRHPFFIANPHFLKKFIP